MGERSWPVAFPLHPLNVVSNNIVAALRSLYAGPGSMEQVWAAIKVYESSEANTDPKGLARWVAKLQSEEMDADTLIGFERFISRTNNARLRAAREAL